MNVIFLDIDGVLNSPNYATRYKNMETKKERTYKNIDDSALKYLQKLQNKKAGKGNVSKLDIKETVVDEKPAAMHALPERTVVAGPNSLLTGLQLKYTQNIGGNMKVGG